MDVILGYVIVLAALYPVSWLALFALSLIRGALRG